MFCLHVCMCTTYMPGAGGGKKRMVDPLGLELLTPVSPQLSAGTLILGPLEKQMRPSL